MSGTKEKSINLQEDGQQTCPYCAESILSMAKKCRFCGEFLEPKKNSSIRTTMLAYIGLFTATLSVFFTLREGYYYIQLKQQQRAEVASYEQVAEYFNELDSLEYAQQALSGALELAPNNVNLQRRLLILQAQDVLRNIEWNGLQQQNQQQVQSMILNGHRLLNTPMDDSELATLKVIIAQLLPLDQSWVDDQGIDALYAQAYELSSESPEVNFRYGLWLTESVQRRQKGIQLIQQAVTLNPEDALYSYELARLLAEEGQTSQAFSLFRRTASLIQQQKELQRIRAANLAKSEVKKMIINADFSQQFDNKTFLGLSLSQTNLLMQQVIQDYPDDKNLSFALARFYYASQQFEEAERMIVKCIDVDDLGQIQKGYYEKQYKLYGDILAARGQAPDKLAQIEQALAVYEQNLLYDKILEMGVENEHRYKIGLKVRKTTNNTQNSGLEIIEVYSYYPFAKAGVEPGDLILKLAHRQPASLSSVYQILSNFKPGSIVSLVVQRNEQQLDLELVVE